MASPSPSGAQTSSSPSLLQLRSSLRRLDLLQSRGALHDMDEAQRREYFQKLHRHKKQLEDMLRAIEGGGNGVQGAAGQQQPVMRSAEDAAKSVAEEEDEEEEEEEEEELYENTSKYAAKFIEEQRRLLEGEGSLKHVFVSISPDFVLVS